MHGVNLLSVKKTYDIYASSLRFLAVLQIIAMLAGTALLISVLRTHQTSESVTKNSIEIKLGAQQSVAYPIDARKNYTIQVSDGKLTISEANK